MNVRTLCLAILSQGDATGYEIRKASIDGQFSHFVDASFGSIYPALARLESEGRVTWREEVQSGKPARKIYSITPAGQAEFAAHLTEPPKADLFRSEFLLIAMFARLAGKEAVGRAIQLRIDQISEERDHLINMQQTCDAPSVQWVTDYGIECMTRSIDYLHANQDRLLAIASGEELSQTDLSTISSNAEAAE